MTTIHADTDCASALRSSLDLMRQSMTDSDFTAAVYGIREAITALYDYNHPSQCHRFVSILDNYAIEAECHLRLVAASDDDQGGRDG